MRAEIQRTIVVFALTFAVCAPASRLHSYVVPQRRTRRIRRAHFRRLRWNPVFRPSHESLLLQNQEIDRMDLPRIQDDAELEQLKASEELVPIVAGPTLRFDPRLDPDRRYCRPWTREFLDDLSAAYYKEFHAQIQVNSAVRTVKVQKKLRRHNRNAAPAGGRDRILPPRGRHRGHTAPRPCREQIKWVQNYMVPLEGSGPDRAGRRTPSVGLPRNGLGTIHRLARIPRCWPVSS